MRHSALAVILCVAAGAVQAQPPPQQTACINRYVKPAVSTIAAQLALWSCTEIHPDPTPSAAPQPPEPQTELERLLIELGAEPTPPKPRPRETALARCLLRRLPDVKNDIAARLAYADCRRENPPPQP